MQRPLIHVDATTRFFIGITATSWVLVSVMVLLACRPASGSERYDAWQAGHAFIQTAWATHRYSGGEKVNLPYFHGSGLNTFWDGVRGGSSASKHPLTAGLPTILMAAVGAKSAPTYGEKGDLPGFLEDFKKAQAAHENLIGVVLGDEIPPRSGLATHMGVVRDWIVNNEAPEIASILTISSVGSMSPDHWDHIHKTIGADVLLFQHYPSFRSPSGRGGYYRRLESFARWSASRGVPWWVYPRAYASDHDGIFYESELRLQRFTSLAYGVRGVADFMWDSGPGTPAVVGSTYWDRTYEPTVTYKMLAPINREIANIARSLIRLTPVGAYHLNRIADTAGGQDVRYWMDDDADLPTWLRRTWRLANVTAAATRNRLLVGFFRDDAGQEYFMVVNKDVARDKTGDELATQVILTFHPSVKAIQRIRRDDGSVERIAIDRHYGFELPGGTGDLFKFDTGSGFAGVEPPLITKLIDFKPGHDRTLARSANNRIALTFDGDAATVTAEIRRLDENGQMVGSDLSDHFTHTVSDDRRTVEYRENGSVLVNKAKYQIVPHWAHSDGEIVIRTLRGDVDGNGRLDESDIDTVTRAVSNGDVDRVRGDVNGDDVVDQLDASIVRRLVHPVPKFRFEDSFENYPAGPLTGRGPWLEVESLPAPLITKAVVLGPALITKAHAHLHGPQKVKGMPYPDYRGNEALFHQKGGVGDGGLLRGGFTVRMGSGLQRISFHISNSRDTEGTAGAIHYQILEQDISRVFTSRGVELLDASDGINGDMFEQLKAMGQAPDSKGFAVEFLVDFDAATITWHCQNMDSGKMFGPRTVHYRGKFTGLDCMSFWIAGPDAQMDHFWLQNH